jgi:hypothetical protein
MQRLDGFLANSRTFSRRRHTEAGIGPDKKVIGGARKRSLPFSQQHIKTHKETS